MANPTPPSKAKATAKISAPAGRAVPAGKARVVVAASGAKKLVAPAPKVTTVTKMAKMPGPKKYGR